MACLKFTNYLLFKNHVFNHISNPHIVPTARTMSATERFFFKFNVDGGKAQIVFGAKQIKTHTNRLFLCHLISGLYLNKFEFVMKFYLNCAVALAF